MSKDSKAKQNLHPKQAETPLGEDAALKFVRLFIDSVKRKQAPESKAGLSNNRQVQTYGSWDEAFKLDFWERIYQSYP